MKKLIAGLLAVLVLSSLTVLGWYFHPGFDRILPGAPIEEGSSNNEGYSIAWKIYKIGDDHDFPARLLGYGYKIDETDSGNGYRIGGEKAWLFGNRWRRFVVIEPTKGADLDFMNQSLHGIGASTTVRVGDHYAIMWSGYANDWRTLSSNLTVGAN